MKDAIKRLMASLWNLDPASIPDDAAFNNLPGWDSLGHITLMMKIEAELGVTLTTEAMQSALTLPALVDFVVQAKGEKP